VEEALLGDAHDVEDQPHQQREGHRHRHAGVGRHLHEGNDFPQVAEEDEREQRREKRREFAPIGSDGLHHDAVVDKVDDRLGHVLYAGGNQRPLAAAQDEQDDGEQGRHPHDEDDLVHRERGVLQEDVGPFDEMADRREFETQNHAAPASLVFMDGMDCIDGVGATGAVDCGVCGHARPPAA
jgi:hypothetical protein